MNKAVLRKIYLEKRNLLNPHELKSMNEQIHRNLFANFDFGKYKNIHTFLPIFKNNEINIWAILMQLRKSYPSQNIIISKSDFQAVEMTHFLYKENTILIENQYGIPEPDGAESFSSNDFDLIFVPLVIFDLEGNRVGYGKGFYDRFLSKVPSTAAKVGLSLFNPVPEINDIHENDIRLDYCVTPTQFFSFL